MAGTHCPESSALTARKPGSVRVSVNRITAWIIFSMMVAPTHTMSSTALVHSFVPSDLLTFDSRSKGARHRVLQASSANTRANVYALPLLCFAHERFVRATSHGLAVAVLDHDLPNPWIFIQTDPQVCPDKSSGLLMTHCLQPPIILLPDHVARS